MSIHLHHLHFNRSLDMDLHETPIYVYKYNTPIILMICIFSFFLLNPLFAILLMALFSLLVSGNSKSILLILTIALTLFYSSRNFGVSWSSGEDDALQYLFNYQNSLNESLANLFKISIENISKTEFFYYCFWWILGKLINPEPQTFFFLEYLFQITLLSIAAYLVSKKYAIIFIFIFYFGITDPNHQVLHLWRASFAFFIFLIGILIYFKGNMKIGRILVYLSFGFHVSILVNIIIFELFNILIKRKDFFRTVVLGAIITFILSLFYTIAFTVVFPSAAFFFYTIDSHLGMSRIIVYSVVLITLVAANYYYKLSTASQFASFLFIMYLVILFQLGLHNPIMTRLLQITVPFIGIALFEIVMKQSKVIIAFIIIFLFLHTIIQPVNDMYFNMLPKYRDLFYGVFNILYL